MRKAWKRNENWVIFFHFCSLCCLRLSFRSSGDDDTPRARFHRERAYSGPLTMHGTSFDQRFMNGFSSTSKQIAGMLLQ